MHQQNHQPRLIKEEQPAYSVDDAQKAEYRERLRQYLQDPDFRQIEGFPLGSDEDILALSDPPYYTACPNPFLPEIIEQWQADKLESLSYNREPFASDVSEGKNNPIYNAHSYHTKVPHKAIMRYILHYTDPSDIVFDGFCGTGMTGVAAQLCDDRKEVQSLGYRVDEAGIIYDGDQPISRLGARKAILNDLSPAATFIAYNYNTPVDVAAFKREAQRILDEVEAELGWMYETWHPHCDDPKRAKAKISYTVWSEVFSCPNCSGEIVFHDEAMDPKTKRVHNDFPCPHCQTQVSKRLLDKVEIVEYDAVLGTTVKNLKRVPVIIEYKMGKRKFTKRVDQEDLRLLERIEKLSFPAGFVNDKLPYMHMTHERAIIANYGVTHLHHFFLARARQCLQALWDKATTVENNRIRQFMFYTVEQTIWGMSLLNRYGPTHFSQVNRYLSGVYYISSLISEVTPWYILNGKIKRLIRAFSQLRNQVGLSIMTTESTTGIQGTTNSVDYIFTDPPFGENIYYSDLNYLVESWHRVWTNSESEAIIDKARQKKLVDYQSMMRQAFGRYYHMLKPGRWMTVEFHNSHNSVWNAIQEALLSAGFVVADVRTLDKKQKSYRQVTAGSAAKQDLVISAYKPDTEFEARFLQEAGSEEGAWEFIRQHLGQLPVVVANEGVIETLSERQDYLLFDRMVAFHIQRGASVPLSASQFYAGLRQRFIERDSMFFLPDQAPAYDKARLEAASVAQLSLFVTDEKSSIQWLRQQLAPEFGGFPQTYQEIQPQFLKQLHQLKHEALPELGDILEQNFLQDDQGRWYMPDPNKASDLEKLRQKALLHEFNDYRTGKKKLRQFRTEAIRAGFAHAWANKEYAAIVRVAERLPDKVLQEDPDLLMYYDNASLLS
jgi:DNA modification methylase